MTDRYQDGWIAALDAIRASLSVWPDGGCDVEVAKAVGQIVGRMEARALAAEKVIADALKYWRDTYACTDRVVIMSSILKSVDLTAAREMMRKAEEADTLRRQLAEAEALVERMRDGLIRAYGRMKIWNDDILAGVAPIDNLASVCAVQRLLESTRNTPAAALAEYRGSVLEEVAKLADAKALHHKVEAENPLSNFNSQTARSHAFTQFAAEIRAMKEKS